MGEQRRRLTPNLTLGVPFFIGLTLWLRKRSFGGWFRSTWNQVVRTSELHHRVYQYDRRSAHDGIHHDENARPYPTSSLRRRRLNNEQVPGNSSSPLPPSICLLIPSGHSAFSIWRRNSEHIFQASMHQYDLTGTHGSWIRNLLQMLPPHVLQRAIRVTPALQYGSPWEVVMTKITRKLQNVKDPTVPPVRIAVFGGSVTEGRGCNVLPNEVGITRERADATTPRRIIGRSCSWPFRLQQLLDKALGSPGIVSVTNLAVGGTNSWQSFPIIQHSLYPEHSPLLDGVGGLDIIINAYATNDNLPAWNRPRNTTIDRYHIDGRWGMMQSFLNTCRLSQPCQNPPPLVLYFDDYVGNQGNVVLGEMQVHDAIQEIARYGDGIAGYVSSSDSLWRPFILPNTTETLLSPKWKGASVEVHFGMPGHVARTWVFAYALLQWTVDYCQDQNNHSGKDVTDVSLSDATSTKFAPPMPSPSIKFFYNAERRHIEKQTIPTEQETTMLHNVSKTQPFILHQNAFTVAGTFEQLPLSIWMRFMNITTDWRNTIQSRLAASVVQECDVRESQSSINMAQARPCTFAFVAAPMGTHPNAKDLNMYVSRYATVYQDWLAQDDIKNGWQNKLGVVAQKPGARLVLRLPNITTPIKVVTLHYLKSYGDKWRNSTANFTLTIHRRDEVGAATYQLNETSWQLVGYHNQETSISYPHTVDLGRSNQAEPGDSVDLKIELIGGTTFKILTLLLCNR